MALFPKLSTVKVKSPGSYDKGQWIEGIETPTIIQADAQPMTGKEIEVLSVGRANLGKIKIYTDSAINLNIADETTQQNGDLFVKNGQDYEIIAVDNNEVGLIPHHKYIAELRVQADDF